MNRDFGVQIAEGGLSGACELPGGTTPQGVQHVGRMRGRNVPTLVVLRETFCRWDAGVGWLRISVPVKRLGAAADLGKDDKVQAAPHGVGRSNGQCVIEEDPLVFENGLLALEAGGIADVVKRGEVIGFIVTDFLNDDVQVFERQDGRFLLFILPRQQNLWVVCGSGSRPNVWYRAISIAS